ncbi:hypothetical protein [Streptomyces sp. NPDC006640]|uniref:hypothetical protein n=1 Tax=unclassified Streptomyces TaxID=2593676 RepID=UPI00368B0BB9
MGVGFSHTAAQWAYIGFGQFRRALALFEGIDLDAMVGFGGARDWSTVHTDLAPLLDHSDCDGELTPAQCRQVAPRLRQVIDELWPADRAVWAIDPGAHLNRTNGLALADGMDAAAETGEPLQFR